MKRFSCTNSLITSLYPSQEKQQQEENCHYSREFQAMLDDLDDKDITKLDEVEQDSDKKRRLSYKQVKALERTFEVDNKLDPCRKVTLAHELGLQPRQVAIWFQNRRARWKIKQLEMDYNTLKANYKSLRLNYGQLEQNKLVLTTELKELKAKLGTENVEKNMPKVLPDSDSSSMNQETIRNFQLLTAAQGLSNPGLDFCLPSQLNAYEELMHPKSVLGNAHQQQWMKMEDESCNIYSVDQVLTFGW